MVFDSYGWNLELITWFVNITGESPDRKWQHKRWLEAPHWWQSVETGVIFNENLISTFQPIVWSLFCWFVAYHLTYMFLCRLRRDMNRVKTCWWLSCQQWERSKLWQSRTWVLSRYELATPLVLICCGFFKII